MVGVGGGAGGALVFLFLFPIAFAVAFAPAVWPVTFLHLVMHSPHKSRFKWWLFMPFASFAASLVGCVKAGLLFWIPAFCYLWLIGFPADEWSAGSFLCVGIGAATAIVFSTEWMLKVDAKLHEGT